jgi:uncharacterized membrane protein YpjA
MEEGIPRKPLKVSDEFWVSFADIYDYGLEMFGYFQAELYDQKIEKALKTLPNWHLAYPLARDVSTSSLHRRKNIPTFTI